METLQQLTGLLLCLTPILAMVIWLALATRRPACPACNHSIDRAATRCGHCGAELGGGTRL